MKKLLLGLLIFFSTTLTVSASSEITKYQACKYKDGTHVQSLVVKWPGAVGGTYNFIKSEKKIYYFAHAFKSQKDKDIFNYLNNSKDSVSEVSTDKSVSSSDTGLFEYNCITKKTRLLQDFKDTGDFFYLTQKTGNYLHTDRKIYIPTGFVCSPIEDFQRVYSLVSYKLLPEITTFSGYPKNPKEEDCTYSRMSGLTYKSPGVFSFQFGNYNEDSSENILGTYIVDYRVPKIYKLK